MTSPSFSKILCSFFFAVISLTATAQQMDPNKNSNGIMIRETTKAGFYNLKNEDLFKPAEKISAKDMVLNDKEKSLELKKKILIRGGSDSGGGNFLEQSFRAVANDCIWNITSNQIRMAALREIPLNKLHSVFAKNSDGEQLQIAVSNIELAENDYAFKSAWSEKKIIYLYKPDWENVKPESLEFRKMVLHELMRQIGVEDDDYAVSHELNRAMIAMKSFRDNWTKWNLRKITPEINAFVMCEENVAVICWNSTHRGWGGSLSILGPYGQLDYQGACYGARVFCPAP